MDDVNKNVKPLPFCPLFWVFFWAPRSTSFWAHVCTSTSSCSHSRPSCTSWHMWWHTSWHTWSHKRCDMICYTANNKLRMYKYTGLFWNRFIIWKLTYLNETVSDLPYTKMKPCTSYCRGYRYGWVFRLVFLLLSSKRLSRHRFGKILTFYVFQQDSAFSHTVRLTQKYSVINLNWDLGLGLFNSQIIKNILVLLVVNVVILIWNTCIQTNWS